ncbi:MAG TPA: S8 family peptidase [Verrucomicrobiae bacterium]|nr:S8 family peptidase [Verrucomicrobiae bacterium]
MNKEPRYGWLLMVASGVVSLFVCLATSASAQSTQTAYREDQILVKPKAGIDRTALNHFHLAQKSAVLRTFKGMGSLQILSVPRGETVQGLIAKYQKSGLVEFAEPDYLGHVYLTPNDPGYTNHLLWGLDKIAAPAAWNVLTSASNIVVAVLDTGVRYTHQDLAANMWVNPNDGSHGWNVLTGTNDPSDDNGHGTMVAGVLGAVGNNGIGVVGVAWQVQIMACKCFNNLGIGSISSVITGMDYAETNGARIINASWGFTNSLALSNAVYSLRDSNIIIVAACGNNATNIDLYPTYPASYQFDNVVTVAATSTNDTLSAYSNYGATSVHLGAPGDRIYSTFGASDSFYYTDSGTSFAAPYVAGALALMLTKYPAETYQQIISRLLNATDPLPSLAGKCVTGGRLNLQNALNPPIKLTVIPTASGAPFQLHLASGPNRTCVIQTSTDLTSWTPVFTNTTSTNGIFDFTDFQSTNSAQNFYRATASP